MKTRLRSAFEKAVWWTGVVSMGLVVGLSVQFARAWVSPTQAPPGGNVGAPINTGTIGQFKNGVMRALGLQTPNLRVEPATGIDPTGQFLAAVNSSGDVAYAAGDGDNGGGISCVENAGGMICVRSSDGRLCQVMNNEWKCIYPKGW